MIYPHNFEQKTGFNQIRELVTARCLSPLGEEKVDEMAFSSQYETIRKQLYQTKEFVQIIQEEDNFPSDYFFDVRDSLKKIRIDGTYLLEKELFDIRRSLETINAIVLFFHHTKTPYPHLQELASDVATFPKITKQIDHILDKFGEIKDNATPELSAIRKQLSQTVNSISKTLHSILRAAQSEGLVEKDVTPTMRDGRLVIPISPAFKRKLKGIVHDESASGKTVFIEPAEVVEANNRIRELENEEKREIVRILTAFTNQIRPEIPEILQSYLFLAEIDFIRAKASFALNINAILPIFEDKQQIDWLRAIHPLLYLSHKKQNKPVVPLDIELNPEKGRLLIISGPNAGGKSVCLKTAGLLQYMLQCGILIPVYDTSHTGIFNDIFIDIGDEQSIENDLSSYSSHLTNMKFMVKNANPKSLILIDEFGGGTEPQIGGAIAEALLHRFNDKQSFGIVTTHYQNLKTFAESHEGVINGAMLYDRQKMQPLFQLSIGQPGSSFAIDIARKIGLPEDVIAEASEKVGKDYIDMDKYLQDIIRDKRYWESKRQSIRQQEKRLEEQNERYQSHLEKIENQRKEIISQAKTNAEHILSETNAIIEKTIREIKEAQAEKEKTKDVRKTLDDFKQSIQEGEKVKGKGYKERYKKSVTGNRQPAAGNQQPVTGYRLSVSPIEAGDTVRIKGQQAAGQVIEIKGKNVIVAFGAIKTSTKLELLEKVSNNQLKREIQHTPTTIYNNADTFSEKKLHFKSEIDIRGMRGEEAMQAIIYYIDDAIQCNAGRVRILHGTGTGALRQIVRDYLKTVQGIKNFHDEHVQFGGTGITVVELE
jgi:DNA mismatch repair protein MutS2